MPQKSKGAAATEHFPWAHLAMTVLGVVVAVRLAFLAFERRVLEATEREAPLTVHSQRGMARKARGGSVVPPSMSLTRQSCHSPDRCRFASRL
jgi:hypothetical protein